MKKRNAYLLLGSNLGDREASLISARKSLATFGEITATSALYETEAWGLENQPMFLNQALILSTDLPPEELLVKIAEIEETLGRVQTEKWHPRIIDIDILGMDDLIVETDELSIPHPCLHERNFALIPLLEIAPEWVHPVLNVTVEEMYLHSEDQREVFIFSGHE